MNTKNSKQKPARKRLQSPFAGNLKTIMREHNLTQRRTSDICGVSVAVVNEWLSGSQPHDLNAVLKLCKQFKIDFKWLLTAEKSELSDIDLKEIFNIEDDPTFSGIFLLEAKRLKRKGRNDK